MRDNKQILMVIFLSLLMLSCKKDSTVVDPPATVTPGKQTDIEWPSLAKSSWPMISGSPQFTWRSKYSGPKTIVKNWQLLIPGVNSTIALTSPVTGEDSTIYFASSYEPGSYLYACTQSGTIKWKVQMGKDSTDHGALSIDTAPIVLSNGSIVIATPNGYVLSFSPTGKLQWVYQTGTSIYCATVTVGKTGVLYFIDNNSYLYSLKSTGTLNWKVKYDAGFNNSLNSGVAISPDGNTLYVSGMSDSTSLYAISTNGDLKWVFNAKAPTGTTPLVDNAGNIYIEALSYKDTTNRFVYSLKSDGTVRWKYKMISYEFQNLTMDWDGNIYVYDAVNNAPFMFSLDYNGKYRWSYNQLNKYMTSALTCDGDNTVYTFTDDLYAISEGGTFLRNYSVPRVVWTAPMIGYDNSFVLTSITSSGNYLIKIK